MAGDGNPCEYATGTEPDDVKATDKDPDVLECVINISEGRDEAIIGALAAAAGDILLDVHRDADHHRSVFTLGGAGEEVESGARRLASAAAGAIDVRRHVGVHPRLGAIDVVPWIALTPDRPGRLGDGPIGEAVAARDRFARWAAAHLALPCFLYGPAPARQLPDLRKHAWRELKPDVGPLEPHPALGAACVGARRILVAYNLWLEQPDISLARRIASELRAPAVRTLGLAVGDHVQVSCNLVDPWSVGPADVFDAVAAKTAVARAELVGLLPLAILDAVPASRWADLDLADERTIEARLGWAGLDGGRFT